MNMPGADKSFQSSCANGLVFSSMIGLFFLVPVFVLAYTSYCCQQTDDTRAEPPKGLTKLTGILLVSDLHGDEWPESEPRDRRTCPERSSHWGLTTRTKQYTVRGNKSTLKRYGRRRVTGTGTVSPGDEDYMDRFDVQSIGPSEMTEAQIRDLIEDLRQNHWTEPKNIANPTLWIFHFTAPTLQILQAGPAAQDTLLKHLDDPQIKDQIIILLGGVGNENAVAPIIHAMPNREETHDSAYAKNVNLAANLALTNIPVGDVIWHHGRGITRDRCPDDPKSCWCVWWVENKGTFEVTKAASRNYSNYPGYGIYQDPRVFHAEWFR